eukprot:PLAT16105.1.p1 GENE.PLAT16105.1~~PLAT16105.1.p1  ORF type:complete len:210 (-),score=50.53 PLAT16105.1:106-735(-)
MTIKLTDAMDICSLAAAGDCKRMAAKLKAARCYPGKTKTMLSTRDLWTGWYPLHFAVASNQIAAVKLLLEWGARVDAQEDEKQRTALHLAASSGRRRLVSLLLKAGASLRCRDADGFNVLQLAMESGQAKLLEALLSADKSRSHKRVLLTGHPESSCEFGSCSDCWGDDYSGEVDAVLHSHWQKYKDAKFEREAAAMRAELDALRSGMR